MISLKNITKSFGGFVAVKNLSIEITEGEIYGLLGSNGAGKSTTINILLGFLEPDNGEAFIDGINVTKHADNARKKIGYISENVNLYPYLTGLENLNYFNISYDNPLFGSGANFVVTASNGQYSFTDFGITVSELDFYHVVATYSGSAGSHLVRLYINGKSNIANTFGSMGGMSNSRLYVARPPQETVLGRMDLGMLRAYNRELTADEVENAYYATIGKYRT